MEKYLCTLFFPISSLSYEKPINLYNGRTAIGRGLRILHQLSTTDPHLVSMLQPLVFRLKMPYVTFYKIKAAKNLLNKKIHICIEEPDCPNPVHL